MVNVALRKPRKRRWVRTGVSVTVGRARVTIIKPKLKFIDMPFVTKKVCWNLLACTWISLFSERWRGHKTVIVHAATLNIETGLVNPWMHRGYAECHQVVRILIGKQNGYRHACQVPWQQTTLVLQSFFIFENISERNRNIGGLSVHHCASASF